MGIKKKRIKLALKRAKREAASNSNLNQENSIAKEVLREVKQSAEEVVVKLEEPSFETNPTETTSTVINPETVTETPTVKKTAVKKTAVKKTTAKRTTPRKTTTRRKKSSSSK